jgi:hypothetical protein
MNPPAPVTSTVRPARSIRASLDHPIRAATPTEADGRDLEARRLAPCGIAVGGFSHGAHRWPDPSQPERPRPEGPSTPRLPPRGTRHEFTSERVTRLPQGPPVSRVRRPRMPAPGCLESCALSGRPASSDRVSAGLPSGLRRPGTLPDGAPLAYDPRRRLARFRSPMGWRRGVRLDAGDGRCAGEPDAGTHRTSAPPQDGPSATHPLRACARRDCQRRLSPRRRLLIR